MSRRNQRYREKDSPRDQQSRPGDSTEAAETIAPCPGPSPRVRSLASALICAHLAALMLGLSANLAPSYLQGQLTAWLSPYLVTTGQSYQALPLELTHAEPFDFPLWVELLPSDESNASWQPLRLPNTRQTTDESSRRGVGGLDQRFSRWANYSRMIRLIATEQPDSEILSDIAVQLVRSAAAQSARRQNFRAIRLVAPKVLSYDEDAQVASGQLDLDADLLAPTIVFEASVVEGPSGELSLVPSLSPLRTAKPLAQRRSLP